MKTKNWGKRRKFLRITARKKEFVSREISNNG